MSDQPSSSLNPDAALPSIHECLVRSAQLADERDYEGSVAWSNLAAALAGTGKALAAEAVARLTLNFFTEPGDHVFGHLQEALNKWVDS